MYALICFENEKKLAKKFAKYNIEGYINTVRLGIRLLVFYFIIKYEYYNDWINHRRFEKILKAKVTVDILFKSVKIS